MLLLGMSLAMVLGLRVIFCSEPHGRGLALASGILLIAGVQMLILGIVARYIGCILQSVQGRPLYVVESQGGWDRSGDQTPVGPTGKSGIEI
jgi:hypothetical protein